MMRTTVAALMTLVIVAQASAASLACSVGLTTCVKSQGTEIPSKEVIKILDRCAEFVENDIGQLALRLSHQEMLDRTKGKLTPLALAWFAFNDLVKSPLKFERKTKAEETNYTEIKRACAQLDRDFEDDSKWVK